MSKHTEDLYGEIQETLKRFGTETDMTHTEAIGILVMLAVGLATEARKLAEEDDLDGLDAGVPDGI
jgi:hypothetical protein